MADRYYICAMVGNGDDPDAVPKPWAVNTGPWRISLADIPKRDAQGNIIHSFQSVQFNGKYAVVNANSTDFSLIEAWQGANGDYPAVDSIPDVSLDVEMTQAHKSFAANLLKKWMGYSNAEANNAVNNMATYRDALDFMIQNLNPTLDTNKIKARAVS